MPKNGDAGEDGEEAMQLEGSGDGKERPKNPNTRGPRDRRFRFNRVKVFAIAGVVCIVVILLVAWFVFAALSGGTQEWLESIPGSNHHPESSSPGSLILFERTDEKSYKPWTGVIQKFLEGYNNSAENVVQCGYDKPPSAGQVCEVKMDEFGNCNKENDFGYPEGKPCVFLKFNKVVDWVPEFYNDSNNLPEDMPVDLKKHIQEMERKDVLNLKTIWVSCEGSETADKEKMGSIDYLPRRGFPGYYFPYNSTENYMSPLVAIPFENPEPGTLVNVECRVWAPNIEYNKDKGVGLVRFEVWVN
ncbi:sodium/potassium-transporting ATPase subunit beta-2-like [Periplaneta americana]|uniref:sodium/potassium-transporting ATPase subunit beta-2-like n=1 Tax=Periplaneta americana TaxID=6978 RepID=UPI0037E9692B